MPTLNSHPSQTATKLLAVGDSGTGKTGALASLVEAGYTVAILDFDNGLDILVNVLQSKPNGADLLSKVHYETCIDKRKMVAGQLVPDGIPGAFSKALNTLNNWPELGPVSTWDDSRILVIDSLTFCAKAAFAWVEATFNYKDARQTYGETQKRLENFLSLLYSPEVKCNVIVNTHISYIELLEGEKMKAYPSAVGKALSPQIPRYFNTVVEYRTLGIGPATKRVISTRPSGTIDVKTSALPSSIPAELPVETGLATLFKALQGTAKPLSQPPAAAAAK